MRFLKVARVTLSVSCRADPSSQVGQVGDKLQGVKVHVISAGGKPEQLQTKCASSPGLINTSSTLTTGASTKAKVNKFR